GLLAGLLPVMVIAHRTAFRLMLRIIRRRGMNLRHAAVIGVGRVGRIACQTLDRNAWTGIRVGYFISHRDRTERTECLGRPVAGGLGELEKILERRPVDAVYIAIPNAQAAVVPSLLQRLDRFAVDVRIIPDVNPRYLPQSMSLGELDGMPILSYRESPIHGLGGFTKRVLDVAGALAAIIVFGPLMLAIALLVRLSGPGPVIFRQKRVSFGRDVFEIYKFRTMQHVEDEAGVDLNWTRRDDPRVTRIGRWLRRTSLDELPQLFNVLRGEMSLVGPRPERPELIERFREDWRGYMLRQHVKAGMTGWAQVNGLRGDTSLRKRIQHDLFYIRHWSIGFDLKILWLTVFRGFVHRNAH
ncbi:MAG: undecaprenyl-phosphate glucose phosphotransferase, partial [Phycisphaerales bacterium JB039]